MTRVLPEGYVHCTACKRGVRIPHDCPAPRMVCESCGTSTPRASSVQRYCPACSVIKDRERKSRWAREHPAPITAEKKAQAAERHAGRLAVRSDLSVGFDLWDPVSPVDLLWQVRVSVPFSYAMSKNAVWAMGKQGHVHLRDGARHHRAVLADALGAALDGPDLTAYGIPGVPRGQYGRLVQNRLWMDLLVEKPNHRGDAVNVLDTVSDAVQDATGLDDRWYSVRRLDWRVVGGGEAMLHVGIGQESDVESQVCSTCGRVLALDAFGFNSSARTGRVRICRECLAHASAIRRNR